MYAFATEAAPAKRSARRRTPEDEDHFFWFHHATWEDYEHLDRMRGESAVPRLTFLEGTLEIMSPGTNHELVKTRLAALIEAYCVQTGVRINGFGSWTVKNKKVKRGAEADECYVFGPDPNPKHPHLAIEVVWSSGGIDKLEVWRKLGVDEVWTWEDGAISVHVLRGARYMPVTKSQFLPALDIAHMLDFVDRPTLYDSIVDYRAALDKLARAPKKKPAARKR